MNTGNLPGFLFLLSIPEAIIASIVLLAVTDLSAALVVGIAVAYVVVMLAAGQLISRTREG